MLIEYVKVDYAVFYVLLKIVIEMKFKNSHGNVFAQGIHYGATLANHKKVPVTCSTIYLSFLEE